MNKFCIHKTHVLSSSDSAKQNRREACTGKPSLTSSLSRAGRSGVEGLEKSIFFLLACLLPLQASAQELRFQYDEQVHSIMPLYEWMTIEYVPSFRGREIIIDGEAPKGIEQIKKVTWNKEKIANAIETKLVPLINRNTGSVTISKDTDGKITFEGVALPGRKLNVELATELALKALEEGISTIQLPVIETDPVVTVEDPGLKKAGIRELITVGESNYSRSPGNRRYNIALGLKKFNGTLIPAGEEFSFNKTLGPVNEYSGFLKELTILGEKTLPAYGGGLCQVSTTAYRGVWKAGFPITSRRNHSYAVRYYSPPGTDATIFPPWTDMRFLNDTKGSILIQTHHEGDNAYFLYYGTKPKHRKVELVGPINWDHKPPPEDKTETSVEIPPGETRVVSRAVPGMKTLWFRFIQNGGRKIVKEPFLSEYEARPYFQEIGVAVLPDPLFSAKQEEEVIMRDGETRITVPRGRN